VTTDDLKRRDGVFLSLSSWGVVEVQSLDGRVLRPSALVEKIQRAYLDLLRAETR
jgi:branched-subunit amino acid aminotransferase/4-amino-4-deoxychorismate lyase